MTVRSLLALAALIALPATLGAQHGGGTPLVTRAPAEAAQYDFLVGDWELTAKPQATTLAMKIHGVPKLHGSWKAWRALSGWGIEDELRIVDASGNPLALTHFVRVYDAAAKHWGISAVDAYRGQITVSSAEWRGGEMIASGQGTDQDGKAYTSRTTIRDITANGFRYQQDRSFDGGKSWSEGVLTIEAKRVGAVAAR